MNCDDMVTIGGRISCQFAYCKNIQRCRLRQLSTETQRTFQGVGTRSENRDCFLSGTAHSAKNVAAASLSSLHSFSTCCSIGSTSSIIKDNCYFKNLRYRRTGAPLNHFYRQFHHSSLRNLQTDAAPSAFGEGRIHDDKHSPERRSSPMEIDELVDYLHEENASDVCVISVPPSLDYVNYFVVCSGFGTRHLRRMADGLIAEVRIYCHNLAEYADFPLMW